jgi:glycosyltransferase involved in cell wall biosynthesis
VAAAQASPVAGATRIEVETAEVGAPLADRLVGVNMANWYDVTKDGIGETLSTFRISALRWPGGSEADRFHWQTNSACAQAYINPNSTFDRFMQLVAQPGGFDVSITLNYGSNAACNGPGDPLEALAWVDYACAANFNVTYWTIGNEVYGPWEYDLHPKANDAATYAAAVAGDYYPLIKMAHPDALVGVVVNPDWTPPWDPLVLANAKYDFVEYHFYAQLPGEESDSYRYARVTGNARRLQTALLVRGQEIAAIAAADATIAITDADRAVFAALVPGARIDVVGIWWEPVSEAPQPSQTPIVLFIGHYQAAPNHDAAVFLAREVLPGVRSRIADARLELAGSDPSPALTDLAGPGVLVPGWEADLGPRLRHARVFAAPLRFGSGLKGKILQAIAHRVPLVASVVAVEGTGLVSGRDYLPAETAAECADGIVRLLTDTRMGTCLAENAMLVLRQRFSREAVWRQLDAVFVPLLGPGAAAGP